MDRLDAYAVFVKVVEAGSFSAAARELGVTQPTVSKRVAALEAALGAALLHRTTRRLQVTAAGERLYESARRVLDEVARGEAEVRRLDLTPAGELRVNLPVAFGQTCVVPHVASFLTEHPDVTVDLRFAERYVDLLEEGVDLLLRIGRPPAGSMVARRLGVTERVVVAAPAYLAARGTPEHPHQLAAHDALVYANNRAGTRWVFRRGDADYSVRVEPRVRSDYGGSLRTLAREGHGLALLASWFVADELASGSLVRVLSDYAVPRLDVLAIYPSRRFLPFRARRFIEHLAKRFADDPHLT